MKKLDYIDALRGLAILGVIMVHTNLYGSFNLPNSIGHIIAQGARGVQLFFLVSAFTLFLSFKNRSMIEKSPIRNFFLRRFFRIAPMYYIGIAYYLCLDDLGLRYLLGDSTNITIPIIISNFIFLHGFNPYWINSLVPGGWSIGVEMLFYAILPFVFSKVKNLNQAFNFFIFSTVAKLLLQLFFMKFQLISDDRIWSRFLFLYFPNQLPIFSLGILMYFIIIENESLSNISGKSILVFSSMLLAHLCSGIQFILPNHILFGIGLLLLGLALSKFRFIGFVNPIVIYIGKISFSMYLVHFAVLHWLKSLNFLDYLGNGTLNYIARFSFVSILTIIVSSIFYKIIEVPFQEIGKRIIIRLEKSTNA
jgi:peptidoglycan/LPS O-acetylase OafA/YrhL